MYEKGEKVTPKGSAGLAMEAAKKVEALEKKGIYLDPFDPAALGIEPKAFVLPKEGPDAPTRPNINGNVRKL